MAERIYQVMALLKKEYPHAKIALSFTTPLELLVATVLSAQCTDKRVNMVTQSLFKKYRTVHEYASASLPEFEKDIHSTGFYHNKARNIIAAAKMIMADFHGQVPETMAELVQLPGVARKTANIVLYNAFHKVEGIAVDTHVKRLSQRLGLTIQEDPEKIEKLLMALLERQDWGPFSYLLIEHGRAICVAKGPKCPQCVLSKICPYAHTHGVE